MKLINLKTLFNLHCFPVFCIDKQNECWRDSNGLIYPVFYEQCSFGYPPHGSAWC